MNSYLLVFPVKLQSLWFMITQYNFIAKFIVFVYVLLYYNSKLEYITFGALSQTIRITCQY